MKRKKVLRYFIIIHFHVPEGGSKIIQAKLYNTRKTKYLLQFKLADFIKISQDEFYSNMYSRWLMMVQTKIVILSLM